MHYYSLIIYLMISIISQTYTMQLPNVPGLGFYPTNEQLLLLYLRKRILEHSSSSPSTNAHIIPDIDLYRWNPWDLPHEIERLSPLGSCSRDEWYFFCTNPRGKSRQRIVGNVGHWKVIGKAKTMRSEMTEEEIGSMKSLVFYRGCSKTNWVVHECHLNPSCLQQGGQDQMPFVVCCLYKNGTEKDDEESESSSSRSAS